VRPILPEPMAEQKVRSRASRFGVRILYELQRVYPELVSLARISSVASIIDPPLLRQLRLAFPGLDGTQGLLDPGIESDLWHSPLVESSSPAHMVLQPDVLAILRGQLSRTEYRDVALRARSVVESSHAHESAFVRLEEVLIWDYIQRGGGAADAYLQILKREARLSPGAESIVTAWFIQASRRLPRAAAQRIGVALGEARRPSGAPLGATVSADGTTFALWAPRATRVELALADARRQQTNHDLAPAPDGVWSTFVPGIGEGQRYGYRVHGPWSPETGQRFNPAKLLVDPYARAITGGVDYAGPISDHTAKSNFLPDPTDSFGAVPLSVVVADSPPPVPLARPLGADELVVYETHLKGYTMLHPAVPEHLRGTLAGFAYPAVIEHLLQLGVNTVEFLPVHHFVHEPFVIGRGLSNYWGYNTLGFFAPHGPYSSSGTLGRQVAEFKQMVSALHEAGIAVILDVVYNHTAEGGHEGPTLSFRGIDQAGYYRLTDDLRADVGAEGRNGLDTAQPGVLKLVLDSMRYWATDMGVDGFRLSEAAGLIRDEAHHVRQDHPFKQLVAADPVLSTKILIVDPNDTLPSGYQLGRWGRGWSECNDRFRSFVRDFWRGAIGGVEELATRLAGSADIFDNDGRPATSSVNFVTAHDGFTLRDLVTYDLKHNEANGEGNRDGADDNRSWNHGYEGETYDEAINQARHRTVRNMTATLLLSSGIPMLLAGDEMGRTQHGNNNAYCQDAPLSWVNWHTREDWDDQFGLTSTLLKLRADHRILRPTTFRTRFEVMDARGHGLGRTESAWFNEHGTEMSLENWHDSSRRSLGMYVSDREEAFYLFFHGGHHDLEVVLPGEPWSSGYRIVAHTGEPAELSSRALAPGRRLVVPGRTVVVMNATVASRRTDSQSRS